MIKKVLLLCCTVSSVYLIAGVTVVSFIEWRNQIKESEKKQIERHLLIKEIAKNFNTYSLSPEKMIKTFLISLDASFFSSIKSDNFAYACSEKLSASLNSSFSLANATNSSPSLFNATEEIQLDSFRDDIMRMHKRLSKEITPLLEYRIDEPIKKKLASADKKLRSDLSHAEMFSPEKDEAFEQYYHATATIVFDADNRMSDLAKLSYLCGDCYYDKRKIIITKMLSEGIDQNEIKYGSGNTPLSDSCDNKDFGFFRFLLDKGALVNATIIEKTKDMPSFRTLLSHYFAK